MKLHEYIEESWDPARPRRAFPSTLEVPFKLCQEFSQLYANTEQKGRECGYPLFYDDRDSPIRAGQMAEGDATSMSIPKSNSYYNFGNVHAHPSASVGHIDGYCAHSMQDLLTFENEKDKVLFIQFVVSGKKLYAMVYRMGWSDTSDTMKGFANKKKDDMFKEGRNYLIEKNFRKPDDFVDKMNTFGSVPAAENYMNDLKRTTPGFGKKLEEMSIAACTEFARRFVYGFYTGKIEGFGARTVHRK